MDEKLAFPVKKVVLKKEANKSIWIPKKDIKEIPKSIKPGDFIKIFSSKGTFLGTGYINPLSKITIRILSFDDVQITKGLIKEKIYKAFQFRKELQNFTDSIRIVHSEGDFLPGLIIDKYKDIFVIQISTAGMENLRHFIISSIIEIFNPKAIYEKSDEKIRAIEGLTTENGLLYGEDVKTEIINEYNAKFHVNFLKGQKTGFFLDQRKNRKIVSEFAKNKRILDLFSNTGGFGIHCYLNGAEKVKFVEISKEVIENLKLNLSLNNVENYEILKADVFEYIKEENEKYDLIIIDPPAFTKKRDEKKDAIKGYIFLISQALKILNDSGYIAIFSCAHHIGLFDLFKIISNFKVKICTVLMQDIDHPFISFIPNSFYLKGLLLQKI